MAWPSWLATQPPTPMISSGLFALSFFQRPSWWNTFSWAFSRMEQVFSNRISASSGVSVISTASPVLSRSAMRDESYSFIWQPWVLMYSFLAMGLNTTGCIWRPEQKLSGLRADKGELGIITG